MTVSCERPLSCLEHDFLSKFSHEMRNPINAVLGFSDMLLRQTVGPLTEKQADYLQEINASGRSLLGMLADVVQLFRLEAGALRVEGTEAVLDSAVRRAELAVGDAARRTETLLSCSNSSGIERIESDEEWLTRALECLLRAAVAYSRHPGEVTLDVTAAGDGRETITATVTFTAKAPCRDHPLEFLVAPAAEGDGQKLGTGLEIRLANEIAAKLGGSLSVGPIVAGENVISMTVPI